MGDTNSEKVEEYNYLGMLFIWNGKFTKAKTKLAVKASRSHVFGVIIPHVNILDSGSSRAMD